ncbi:tetratricopeptide repeat protein [Billgrantia sp. Q4P2]|uniref:tetratricopeptide repeat protein n=1 Tax=Billgrantia sp. Q4P2 TaxID=3463857 RepID=UPI0040561FF3
MANKDTKNVSFEINLTNGRMIGSSDSKEEVDQDIGRKISESISRAFRSLSSDWIKLFDEKVAEEDYQQAYEIFYENRGLLQFSTDKKILVKLRCMNVSRLDKDSRKEYLTFLIALSSHLGKREETLGDIEKILDEYKDELDPILVQNLYLEKANISAIKGFYNKASLIYKQVISSNDSDSGTIAWAYQGLSKISEADEDVISYAEKAADKHLESGARDEAVKNIIQISNIKSPTDPQAAIQLIDKCIALYGSEKLIDRELLASLKHKKAAYLQRIGKNIDALPIAEEACELRRGLIGNEIELHASLSLAEILANTNGETSKAEGFKFEAESLSDIIKDDNFSLRCEIGELLVEAKVIDEDLMSRIVASGDSSILSAALLYQSTNSGFSLEESIELLDRSRIAVESHNDNQMLDVIHFAIAEKYRNESMIDDAFKHYKKSLACNQFYHSAAQNCVAMLFNENRWKEAEFFIKERIDLIGELPGICFAYAKALYENRKYPLAFKYFKKSDPSIEGISDYIADCLENIDDKDIISYQEGNSFPEIAITAEQFYEALEEFSKSISADSRMHFWDKDKKSGKYKWTKKPEELSKQMLITFLNGKFGKDAIEILQESKAGAGFIDLYVLLPGGLKVVIELKMCGNGYSSGYALSGESQIIHYQINKFTKLGYLVVFDARVRDYGKHFKKLQMINDHTIYSIAIDLRSEIAK